MFLPTTPIGRGAGTGAGPGAGSGAGATFSSISSLLLNFAIGVVCGLGGGVGLAGVLTFSTTGSAGSSIPIPTCPRGQPQGLGFSVLSRTLPDDFFSWA